MNKRKKRKPDFRRIGPSRTYSVVELADAVQRSQATVRAWLREGLPTLDGAKPTVIDGAQAKKWLKEKWANRKIPAMNNQAHCLRCRTARPFAEGSLSLKCVNSKVHTFTGLCAACGCTMNKFVSAKSVTILDNTTKHTCGGSAA